MTRNRATTKNVPGVGSPRVNHWAWMMWLGWEDVRNNRPYHDRYEHWVRNDQLNYELGRQLASTQLPDVPHWPQGMAFETLFMNKLKNLPLLNEVGMHFYQK